MATKERSPAVVAGAWRFPFHQVHDLRPHGKDGAERAERVLGNERDGAAPDAIVDDRGILAQEIAALEAHLAAANARGAGGQDAENGAGERGLAAAALAHE